MNFSDDESLEGLTQVPSQKRDSEGNFKLRDAKELIDCSGNVQADFDEFAALFMEPEPEISFSENSGNEKHDVLADLFPTPPEENAASQGAHNVVEELSIRHELVQAVHDAESCAKSCENVPNYVVDTEDISDSELSLVMDDYERSQSAGQPATAPPQACTAVALDPFEEESAMFNKPRSLEEMDEMGKKRVSSATHTKILWACRAYERWLQYRRKMHIGRVNEPSKEQWWRVDPLENLWKNPEVLARDVCDFIVEVRKENGQEHPPGTVYDLVLCISLYLEREHGIKRLTSLAWPKIQNTLDYIMFKKTHAGLGQRKERDFVSEYQENYLWAKGFLGEDTPDKLRLTVFFLLGKYFGLRGGSEHRDLVHYPSSQIQIEKQNDSGNDIMLVYREYKSKMNQGGLASRNVKKPRVAYAFPNAKDPSRCPMRLFIHYVRFCPLGSDDSKAFYLHTNVNWQTCALWYTRQPIGKGQLNDYLKNLMAEAGFVGNFSNHSLRATTATRPFQHDCPEQLIAEQTGHASNAIRHYKKSSLAQKKEVSQLLAGQEKSGENGQEVCVHKHDNETTKVAEKSKNDDEKGHSVHLNVPHSEDYSHLQGLVNIHFHFNKKIMIFMERLVYRVYKRSRKGGKLFC